MKNTSTVRVNENMIFKGHKLTIGLDLGDRWSCFCVLDEAGEIFLFQNDFARFIQNAVARPAIAEVQTNRELVSFENHVFIYPNSASVLHSRSPFLLRLERVDHWERIASRGRPAFSSHLSV